MSYDHEAPGHAPVHHQSSLMMYFSVFFALMIMTGVTVWASKQNFHEWNTPIAMAIAVVKATLVILFFMHVVHSPRLTWIVVICSFLWLSLLFVLTFSDYFTRAWQLY